MYVLGVLDSVASVRFKNRDYETYLLLHLHSSWNENPSTVYKFIVNNRIYCMALHGQPFEAE
jgi:hypothetical protein